MNPKDVLYEWTTSEYVSTKKTVDWYWAVGIIATCATVASIIYRNFLFAIFVILGAGFLIMFQIKKPKQVDIKILKRGIMIDNYLYSFDSIKSFWVDNRGHRLYLHSDRIVLPMMAIPLGETNPETVRSYLAEHLKEEEVSENSLSTIVDKIGF